MRFYILTLVAVLSLSFSCNSSSENSTQLTEAEKKKMYDEAEQRAKEKIEENYSTEKSVTTIEGKWSKTNNLPCTDGFPNTLNLSKGGGFSTDDMPTTGLEWVSGSYKITSEDEITLRNAEKNEKSYQFRHFPKMAIVTLHLSEECTLVYKKSL